MGTATSTAPQMLRPYSECTMSVNSFSETTLGPEFIKLLKQSQGKASDLSVP
jgi:hypothetical protein